MVTNGAINKKKGTALKEKCYEKSEKSINKFPVYKNKGTSKELFLNSNRKWMISHTTLRSLSADLSFPQMNDNWEFLKGMLKRNPLDLISSVLLSRFLSSGVQRIIRNNKKNI